MAEDDKDENGKRPRRTIDEKFAALADQERRLQKEKRAARTHGLIEIATRVVAKAKESWAVHALLHNIWLSGDKRDREAIRIACGDIDVTKPPPKPKADAPPSHEQGVIPPPTKSLGPDQEA